MKVNNLPNAWYRTFGKPIVLVAALTAAAWISSAEAQTSDGATKILKSMSDYVASQKDISLTYDSDVEVITSEVEKI